MRWKLLWKAIMAAGLSVWLFDGSCFVFSSDLFHNGGGLFLK